MNVRLLARLFLSGALLIGGACATVEHRPRPASAPPSPARSDGTRSPAPAPAPPTQAVEPPGYDDALAAIALEIERLKPDFPQLAGFSARTHCDRRRLVISYDYRTHEPRHRGGWTSGVPNPDDDGIWFHIDFHDPDSRAQIHTQPVVADLRYRGKKVMLLILEGAQTRPLAPALHRILHRHGVHGPEQ